jgi:hypothetical protein
MLKNRKILLWLLFSIFILLLIISLIYWYLNNRFETFVNVLDTVEQTMDDETNTYSEIPNILWFFWDGEPLAFVDRCIDSWKKYNPNYEIHILNKQNIDNYLPEVKINDLKFASQSMARYSDFVRLNILSKYGGVWIDASSICHRSLNWIHSIQNKYKVDMIGFYLEGFTTPEYKDYSPVIESWFFACTPNSPFVKDWCKEFMRLNDFDTIDQYLEQVKSEGCNFQKIDIPDYLAIHIAAQVILQKNPNTYNICILSAEKGPYKYLVDTNWDPKLAIQNLNNDDTRYNYYQLPFIKLRGLERLYIPELPSYEGMFS